MKSAEPLRRILVPTDFSPASQLAFEHAERLAVHTNAELLVVHVFDMPDFWGTYGKPNEVDEEIKKLLLDIKPMSPNVSIEHIAHGGAAGAVICWLAQERKCDQIVIGTHGRTGLTHVLLGSVAEYVVRHARCPVLTVRLTKPDEKPLKEPEVYLPMPPLM